MPSRTLSHILPPPNPHPSLFSGAMVIWVKSGHHVTQENKSVVLDLLDVLARPQTDHVGDIFIGDINEEE